MTDPILVVGSGPTGLTAALELSRFGLKVRLIDKRDAPQDTSRAIGIQARTLELMDRRGLAQDMVRLGNKGRYGSIYGGGRRLFRLDFAHAKSRFDYMLFLSQAETERILRDAVADAGVHPEWKTEMVALGQDALSHDASPASAVLKLPDGSLEYVKTPWIIAAEGAHSVARTTLDLHFEGKTLDEHYALGDVRIDGDLPDTDMHIFSSEHGFMGLFPMGGDHFRLIASNPPGEQHGSGPTEAELQEIYDQRSAIPARFHDMIWSSWFRINSRMVNRLKIGRILLGGDSAHIHSPAGGQGMNTGIQDMINLCWKLAFVMQGKAPATLLDTYEQDRLPVMRDVLFKTENLTELIGLESHIIRSLFNHVAPVIAGTAAVQTTATNQMAQLKVGYADSPLSEDHLHAGAVKAGDRLPDVPVSTGHDARQTSLHDLLDPSGFVLFVAHAAPPAAPDPRLTQAASHAQVPIAMIDVAPPSGDGAAEYRHQFGESAAVFLVRPDGYVAFAAGAHSAPDLLAAYVRRWLCAVAA